jgi:hypothetical protein
VDLKPHRRRKPADCGASYPCTAYFSIRVTFAPRRRPRFSRSHRSTEAPGHFELTVDQDAILC